MIGGTRHQKGLEGPRKNSLALHRVQQRFFERMDNHSSSNDGYYLIATLHSFNSSVFFFFFFAILAPKLRSFSCFMALCNASSGDFEPAFQIILYRSHYNFAQRCASPIRGELVVES